MRPIRFMMVNQSQIIPPVPDLTSRRDYIARSSEKAPHYFFQKSALTQLDLGPAGLKSRQCYDFSRVFRTRKNALAEAAIASAAPASAAA